MDTDFCLLCGIMWPKLGHKVTRFRNLSPCDQQCCGHDIIISTWPINIFYHFQDCVRLLNTSAGSLILSLETLQTKDGDKTLRDLGISRLTVEQAVAVIQTRVDLSVWHVYRSIFGDTWQYVMHLLFMLTVWCDELIFNLINNFRMQFTTAPVVVDSDIPEMHTWY